MRAINMSNAKSRNAQVCIDIKAIKSGIKMYSPDGRKLINIRMLKFTPDTAIETLI